MEDMHVPKEKFLVDYFESKKQKVKKTGLGDFDIALTSAGIKIEKKYVEPLLRSNETEANQAIDKMSPRESVDALKESVSVIRGQAG